MKARINSVSYIAVVYCIVSLLTKTPAKTLTVCVQRDWLRVLMDDSANGGLTQFGNFLPSFFVHPKTLSVNNVVIECEHF